MRRFLLAMILFMAPLALLGAYVEWKLSRIPNGYTQKREIIANAGVDARVVVLGSPRDLNGISPNEFDCAGVNLAYVSESLFFSTEVMRRQLRTAARLRLVILGLAHFSYEYELGDSPEAWRGFYYHRFLGTHLDGGLTQFDVRNVSLIALYGRRKVLEFAGKGFDVNLGEPFDARGWSPLLSAPDDPSNEVKAQQRADLHASLMKPEHTRENVAAFETMLEDLEKRGVAVALAMSPVSQAYARSINGAGLVRMQAETAALVARHGLLYRDYTSDPRFDTADFFNSDHLTPLGALKYSRILNEEIVRPLAACATGEPAK